MEENELPGLLGAGQLLLQPKVSLVAWPIVAEPVYLQANKVRMAVVKGMPPLILAQAESVEIVIVVKLMVAQGGEGRRMAKQLSFYLEKGLPSTEGNQKQRLSLIERPVISPA